MKDMLTERADHVSLAKMSRFFKVMGDPTRLHILMQLMKAPLCVMHISEKVGMSQSAVSHQLAVLREAELVRVTRKGKSLIYAISDEHVRLMLDMALLHVGHSKEVSDHE